MFFDNLLQIRLIWFDQFNLLSTITPRNFKEETCFISELHILIDIASILHFFFVNTMKFVLLTLINNLFVLSHFVINCNSLLKISCKELTSLCEKNIIFKINFSNRYLIFPQVLDHWSKSVAYPAIMTGEEQAQQAKKRRNLAGEDVGK